MRNELTEILLGKEVDVKFVSIAQAVQLHDQSTDRVGGATGVRDISLLESALHRPMQKCVYEGETNLFTLAAALADGIAQNHTFVDGNKRTSFLCCVAFLSRNGIEFSPDVATAVEMFRKLASHEIQADSLAQWIEESVEENKTLQSLYGSHRQRS